MARPRLVLFTRYPEPGKAKTRMIAALGTAGAAALHRRLTERTLATMSKTGLPVKIRFTGAARDDFAEWLGSDRALVDQGDGDLGARMRRATVDAPVILLGSDCPDLAPHHIATAAAALETKPVVIGPAADGGYWLLGLAAPLDFLFDDMEWGSDRVLPETLARLRTRGIEPVLLETLADCDRPEDLARWPEIVSGIEPHKSSVAIVVPMLNEEAALPALIANIAALDPAPAEVIAVDGGSGDTSVGLANAAGFTVVEHGSKGRAIQLNRGVEEASAPLILVLHADTALPPDALAVAERTLADPRTALAGFMPILTGIKTRWGTTFHNWAKTWYGPILLRPHRFLRGLRLLFGDHAMFFRRADFLKVEGCDPDMHIMEDVDLCLRLNRLGRVRMVPRFVRTSDRRVAEWGALKANWIYLKCGMSWAFGRKKDLHRHYPDIR